MYGQRPALGNEIPSIYSTLAYLFRIAGEHKKVSPSIANAFIKVYAPQNRAYLEFNTETSTPGYHYLKPAWVQITNSKGQRLFTFVVLGNNLFDMAYFSI